MKNPRISKEPRGKRLTSNIANLSQGKWKRLMSSGLCNTIRCHDGRFAVLHVQRVGTWCMETYIVPTLLSLVISSLLLLGFWLVPCYYLVAFPLLLCYRKIPKINPGACIFQRSFLRGLSTEGNLRFKIDWASLIVESKFTVFALFYFVFEGNCTWRGLFSAFNGTLLLCFLVTLLLCYR